MVMPEQERYVFLAELDDASTTRDDERIREHLERAHELAQPYRGPHVRSHVAMIVAAVRGRGTVTVATAFREAVTCMPRSGARVEHTCS